MKTGNILLIAGICTALLLSNCTLTPVDLTGGSPLVGTWDLTRQITYYASGTSDTTDANTYFSNTYEFGGDYSLSGRTVLLGIPIEFSGSWSEDGDVITITTEMAGSSSSATYQFAVAENNLALTSEDTQGGSTVTTVELYVKR